MNQHDIVTAFRKEKFTLDEYGQINLSASLRKDMESMLETISKDLYSSDVHFLYELIQNAQDNSYPVPQKRRIQFTLLKDDPTGSPDSEGCLCVINNELGFNEEDIKSICSAGQSTKKKKKIEGFIGEKGIGFKSVFKISSFPHIFSNGFHIHFKDRDPDIGLGFIFPYWVDQIPAIVQDNIDKTCILLPLKKDCYEQIKAALLRHKPETSLFLNNLQEIVIDLGDEDYTASFDLVRQNDNIVSLTETINGKKQQYQYWLAEKKILVPDDLHEAKREGVSERTIIVALPLDNQSFDYSVFAYLPSDMKSGLPFLINADFLMTSSRETFNESPWNEWLLEELAEHGAECIEKMLKSAEHGAATLLFIPNKADVKAASNRFSSLYERMIKALKQKTVIKCADGVWRLPKEARQVNATFRKLFAESPLKSRNYWVDSSFALSEYSSALNELDIFPYYREDVIPFYEYKEWIALQDDDWFITFYDYLFLKQKRVDIKEVSYLNIFPTDTGKLYSTNDKKVFIPINHTERAAIADNLYFPEVQCLRERLYNLITAHSGLQSAIVAKGRINHYTPSNYYEHTLREHLNLLSSQEQLQSGSLKEKVALIRWVIDHWNQLGLNSSDNSFPVLFETETIKLVRKDDSIELLVPREPSPSCWSTIFSPDELANLNILHKSYRGLNEDKYRNYRSYLTVEDIPNPVQSEQRGSSSISGHYSEYDEEINNHFFENNRKYPSTSIKSTTLSLLPGIFWTLDSVSKSLRKKFIEWVDVNLAWSSNDFKQNKFKRSYYTSHTHRFTSPCWYYLTHTAWLKTTQGYRKPSECFINDSNIRHILKNSVPYLIDELPQRLVDELKIIKDASSENIISYLKNVSSNNEKLEIKQVQAIYKALDASDDDYKEDFAQEPLVYLPETEQLWFTSEEVVWEDASELGDITFQGLEHYYPDSLRGFFSDKLGVQRNISPKSYAKLWLTLQKQSQDLTTVKPKMDKIYAALRRQIISDKSEIWLKDFADEVLLLSQDGEWLPADKIYIPDDPQLRRIFEKETAFLYRHGNNAFSWMEPLTEFLGVKKLSESVEFTMMNCRDSKSREQNKLLTTHTCWLICYAIKNIGTDGDDDLQQLIEDKTIKDLFALREQTTTNLQLQVSLKDSSRSYNLEQQSAYIDWEDGTIDIDPEAEEDDIRDTIAIALARHLIGKGTSKYIDTFQCFLGIKNESSMRKKLDRKSGWSLTNEQRSFILAIEKEVNAHSAKTESSNHLSEEDPSRIEALSEPETDSLRGHEEQDQTSFDSSGTIQWKTDEPGDKYNPSSTRSSTHRQSSSSNYSKRDSSTNSTNGNSGARQNNATSGGTSPARTNRSEITARTGSNNNVAKSINQARRSQLRSYVVPVRKPSTT